MNRLIIIGASGQGKVVAEIAALNGYTDIVFLDSDSKLTECAGYPVIGPDSMVRTLDGDVFVAIGNPIVRKRIMESESGRTFPVLIHPSAVVAKSARIAPGTIVMAGAVVNPYAKVGCGCIINTCASIDHDCSLGNYVHISVGAHLAGSVEVHDNTWVGIGAVVSNNISIVEDCVIGAGSVVVKSICESGTYFGVPAKKK